MSNDPLQQAIELIHQKRADEAQKLLEPLLVADPHNISAWRWYVETISTDKKRLKALELCLKHNPDNPQARQLFDHFQSSNFEPVPPVRSEEAKNERTSQLILTCLSVISALVITSTWLIIPFLNSPKAPGVTTYYLTVFIIAGQWLLVIPATLIVFFAYTLFWDRNQKHSMPTGKRIRTPLVYNLLAANSLFIFIMVGSLFGSVFNYVFSQNLVLTVKEEAAQSSNQRAYYHAILHVKNNTGRIIRTGTQKMTFALGAFDPNYLGVAWVDGTLPLGESEIEIDIPIYDVPQCGDKDLAKPLSIHYTVPDAGNQFNSIPVSNEINQQLQQIACDAAP